MTSMKCHWSNCIIQCGRDQSVKQRIKTTLQFMGAVFPVHASHRSEWLSQLRHNLFDCSQPLSGEQQVVSLYTAESPTGCTKHMYCSTYNDDIYCEVQLGRRHVGKNREMRTKILPGKLMGRHSFEEV
jgi:hypothetical protein